MPQPNRSVSVLIASRNRESYVRDVLADLQSQRLQPSEVIVVDQSDSPYLLSGCTIIRDEVRGPCHARNRAAAVAKGEILVFLDDDVRIEPTFIESICQPIIDGEYAAVAGAICGAEWCYPEGKKGGWKVGAELWLQAITSNPGTPGEGLTLGLPGGCSAIRKDVFFEIGKFDEYFDPDGAAEDREIALRLFHHGYAIRYMGRARVAHLAAQEGGRRSRMPGPITPLEANLVYVVAKHFDRDVFRWYCRSWLQMLVLRRLTWHPGSWRLSLSRYRVGRRHVRAVSQKMFGAVDLSQPS